MGKSKSRATFTCFDGGLILNKTQFEAIKSRVRTKWHDNHVVFGCLKDIPVQYGNNAGEFQTATIYTIVLLLLGVVTFFISRPCFQKRFQAFLDRRGPIVLAQIQRTNDIINPIKPIGKIFFTIFGMFCEVIRSF